MVMEPAGRPEGQPDVQGADRWLSGRSPDSPCPLAIIVIDLRGQPIGSPSGRVDQRFVGGGVEQRPGRVPVPPCDADLHEPPVAVGLLVDQLGVILD